MKSYQQFFAELKRRHVFRVAAVYGTLAFAMIQIAEPLAHALGLPDAFLTYVVAILLLGFPLAVVLAWAFELTPDGVRTTRSASPEEIEAIVALPASHRWLPGLLALGGILLFGAGIWWSGLQAGRSASGTEAGTVATDTPRLAFVAVDEDPRPSIAVLPFTDMSPEGDQGYFSSGMTEEILNTLTRIRELRVAARTSAAAFGDRGLDLRAIGDSLDVEYLVEGSVRKSGDRLRITAQLIDTEDGSHLWSEAYDRQLDDVFAIQSAIAEAIADELRIPLGLADAEGLVSPTEDLEAYDLYLEARARMRERGSSVTQAVRLFEAAIARDSNWAPPWAGLAEAMSVVPYYAGPAADSAFWAESLSKAEQTALRALELDPRNASAAVALGNAHRDRWEWKQAEAAYERALTLDPDNIEAHQQYAEHLAYIGRTAEALRAARRALALDRSPIRLNVAAYVALEDGQFDDAIAYLREGIRLDVEKRIPWMRGNLIIALLHAGRWQEARQHVMEIVAEDAPARMEEFTRAFPEGADRPPGVFDFDLRSVSPDFQSAEGALRMAGGDEDGAIEFLESFFPVPYSHSITLFNPEYDPLRDDPRFQEILRARGLEGRRPVRTPDVVGEGRRSAGGAAPEVASPR